MPSTPNHLGPPTSFSLPPTEQTGERELLVQRLAEEMTTCWRKGERPPAEHFLDRHPDLWNLPSAVMDLVYEEICLRHEHGESVDSEEIAKRFPRWRQQLGILLNCMHALATPPGLPTAGERFGDFQLLAELGRGGLGRVFLATQSSLGDRPVVLKITPRRGDEHLSLARLQHTHIVPLLSVLDEPARNLRVLCMPYFGGLTLAALLEGLQDRPADQRAGQQILEALDRARAAAPVVLPPGRDPATPFLERASFVQAISWIGACLAEALKYAHERGLVHLDVKPSNVLVTANHQPMLLDFHLARQPLAAGDRGTGFGGTPAYMSPEQKKAMAAVKQAKPLPEVVDGRSDIYSLGLVLHETLGGQLPSAERPHLVPLRKCNPRVPRGLADIIAKCLSPQLRNRYQNAGALAADLWAHLNDLPLKGVANRNLAERWAKWRRRKPHQLAVLALLTAVLIVSGAALAVGRMHVGHRVQGARAALAEGQMLLKKGHFADAMTTLKRGLSEVENLPGNSELKEELRSRHRLATRSQLALELHDIAERFRLYYGTTSLPSANLQVLQRRCLEFWDKRDLILDRLGKDKDLDAEIEQRVKLDLLDLAILGTDLGVRLARKNDAAAARQEALRVLDQAEALFGPSAVLYHERRVHAEALGLTELARQADRGAAARPPRTAWEHYALGRSLLQSDQLAAAAVHLDKAVALQPNGLWPSFYQGICCYRLGHFDDAVLAFTACTTLAPTSAGCFYNRALAFSALGRTDRALRDLDRTLQLEPTFKEAAALGEKLRKS